MLDTREINETISKMAAQQRAVLLWVLDLFVTAVRAEDTTLMTRKAAAILLGPNLVSMQPNTDAGAHLMFIKVGKKELGRGMQKSLLKRDAAPDP